MLNIFAEKLKYFGVSGFILCAVTALAPNSALASAGCDAANAGTFTTSAPANMNTFRQFNTVFDIGDTLFATATGTPLGVGVDVLPGLQTVLSLNGANGTGSTIVNNAGPHTVDITLAGGPGGSAFLTFSCTATMGPPTPPTMAPTTPDATEQSNTAANATTTAIIVEDAVVNGILDGASQEDPEPSGPTPAQIIEINSLNDELTTLAVSEQKITAIIDEEKEELRESIEYQEKALTAPPNIKIDGDRILDQMDLARLFAPAMTPLEEVEFDSAKYDQEQWEKDQRYLIKSFEEALDKNRQRQQEIEKRIGNLNGSIDYTTIDPEDLGDGEEILFAPLDPFMRAINRYRGFTLNASDTTSGPGPDVTPLSFTRTLDPKTVGWVRAVYTDYEQDDASQQDGNDVLIALGAHRDFTDNLRLGAFVTAKWGSVKSPVNALDIDTKGYSLGAYGRYKLGEEIDLNVSTRIGLTNNDISVSGTTGSYDTRLASLTVGISGQEQLSASVWMRPAISLTNTWVNRQDYTNSLGTNIGGNTTWSGNLSAGPTIGTSLTPPEGFKRFEPAIGLLATYTFSDQDSQTGTVTTSDSDYLSLSLSPQLSMEMENGMSLDLFGSYFGIGADLDGWSVGGTISIPLN